MSMLTNNSQRFLVESMRKSLIDSVKNTKTLTESVVNESTKFISEKATYEQLLNMTMNPLRENKYLPVHVLEGAVAILSEAMFTGRKVIGPNAIAQGAINLTEKTDCVITESMLDAAANACNKNSLKVISEAIVMETNDTYAKGLRTADQKQRSEAIEKFKDFKKDLKKANDKIKELQLKLKLAKTEKDAQKIEQISKDLQNARSDRTTAKTQLNSLAKYLKVKKTNKVVNKVANAAQNGNGILGHLGRNKLAYGAAAALAGGALAAKHFANKKNQEEQV